MIEHLKRMAVFARTVERGSFRAAAAELGLSPSVVSHHVGALERELGVRLLHRSTRHLALTADGERLYVAAREVVAAAERGLDAVRAGDEPVGTLRLTAPAILAETRFCSDLADFLREHPRVRLQVDFSELRRDLIRDRFDLALRFGRLDDSALVARRVTAMRRVLVAAPSYLAARPAPRGPADLAEWDLVHLSALPAEIALHPPEGGPPEIRPLRPRISVDSAAAVRATAVAGLGVATVAEVVARDDLREGRLSEVLPGWRVPEVGVYAVWPPGTTRPTLTTRFVAFVAERLELLFG